MTGVTASKTYEPLDVVYAEKAFAWVLPRSKKNECCDYCFKSSEDLITCDDCSEVKYCGTECQEKNRTEHDIECGNMRKLVAQTRYQDDFIRLTARVIHKIKGKNWKEIKRDVLGKTVTFDDIDSHYEELTTNPRLRLLYKTVKESLKDFIGEENMPKENDLIKIIGKVKYSSDSFSSDSPELFCFGMSMFQHECIPNCNIISVGTEMKIWATKKIYKNSDKITVSRRSILTTNFVRAPLSDDSLEVCTCTECSLPYGESVLTKIINDKEAYSVIMLSERVLKQTEVLSALDLENNEKLRALIDGTLDSQEGVLGHTNALHLKLLAIRAMTVEATDSQRRMYLKELERQLSYVFGPYSSQLISVMKSLIVVNFKLGNLLESALYMKKMKALEIHSD